MSTTSVNPITSDWKPAKVSFSFFIFSLAAIIVCAILVPIYRGKCNAAIQTDKIRDINPVNLTTIYVFGYCSWVFILIISLASLFIVLAILCGIFAFRKMG